MISTRMDTPRVCAVPPRTPALALFLAHRRHRIQSPLCSPLPLSPWGPIQSTLSLSSPWGPCCGATDAAACSSLLPVCFCLTLLVCLLVVSLLPRTFAQGSIMKVMFPRRKMKCYNDEALICYNVSSINWAIEDLSCNSISWTLFAYTLLWFIERVDKKKFILYNSIMSWWAIPCHLKVAKNTLFKQ